LLLLFSTFILLYLLLLLLLFTFLYFTGFWYLFWYQSLTLALDRYRDNNNNNNNANNKVSIKSFEDLSESLDSITKTQNLLFNKIQILENKINDILNIIKTKDQQIHLSTTELDKITTQLFKLDLGKTTSQTSTKFILAKPRK